MLFVITAVFLLLYAILIFFYFYYWLHTNAFVPGSFPKVFISVIVAARNEEQNIVALVKSLKEQTYPAEFFEVIIVDDFSTDKTSEKLRPFLNERFYLIQPGSNAIKSSKKKAIEAGIKKAQGELIVITDADCLPKKEWLELIVGFQRTNNSVFVAAPVTFKTYASLLSIFQSLDFITLQGITAASVTANVHSMCNGANLAYQRSVFFEVGGFSGIDKLASGDDMLLMYKIWKKYPQQVHYLKNDNAIIETEPMPNWTSFFEQRIRWASKATYYKDWRISLVLVFVYLFNVLFFVLLILAILKSFYWWALFIYLVGKLFIETPFVYSVAKFYKQQRLLIYFPCLQPLHITYTVLIGILSRLRTYHWKGRKTK